MVTNLTWKYALFHSNKDVGILAECPIDSNKVFREDSGMVYFSMISISGLANRHLEGNVYFKSNDIFKAGGNLGNLIVKTVYGGRCMVGDGSMSKINNEVVNSNAVSLHLLSREPTLSRENQYLPSQLELPSLRPAQ